MRAEESGDGQAGPPTPRRRLKSLDNLRRAVADVWRRAEARTIDPKLARTLFYGASVLASVVETAREQSELVQRIAKLEELVAGRANGSSGTHWRTTTTNPRPPAA